MPENAVIFGKERNLVGIFCPADVDTFKSVIIFLNAGFIYRVGPNRIYVEMAREFAKNGFDSFRFDFSGIGDSVQSTKIEKTLDALSSDLAEAIDYIRNTYNKQDIILFGFCFSAIAALESLLHDSRVKGAIFVNGSFIKPEIRSKIKYKFQLRTAERYYKRNIFSIKKWMKFIKGKSNAKTIIQLIKNKFLRKKRYNNDSNELLLGNKNLWSTFIKLRKPSIFIYSDGSSSLDEYFLIHKELLYKEFQENEILSYKEIGKTDHLFSMNWSQIELTKTCIDWILKNFK